MRSARKTSTGLPLDKEKKFYRVVRSQPPAMITFSYVDRPELVEDFLKPPRGRSAGRHGSVPLSRSIGGEPHVRLGARWTGGQVDRASRQRSDASCSRRRPSFRPTARETALLNQYLGDDPIPVAVFKIQAGKSEPVTAHGARQLADGAQRDSVGRRHRAALRRRRWRRSTTWSRRRSTPRPTGGSGRSTCSPVPTRRFTIAFSAGRKRAARASFALPGRLEKGKPILAFGGRRQYADDHHVSGRQLHAGRDREERSTSRWCFPRARWTTESPACRAEMTVNGQTKEIWLSRSENNLDPPRVALPDVRRRGLRDDVRRRSPAAGIRAQARRLRHRVRARHRAADALHRARFV